MPPKSRTPTQARGEARRRELLDAVVRLLAKQGAKGVTQRAVAEEAGTTHGSTRYYFATREQMLSEALNDIVKRQVQEVKQLFHDRDSTQQNDFSTRLAKYLANRMKQDRDSEIARYELFLDAARNKRLQKSLRDWGEAYMRLFISEFADDNAVDARSKAGRLLNLINGLMLQQLAAPVAGFEKKVLLPAIRDLAT